ncbi:hypothetical protein KIPE111705_34940 [Kibdelosporangium persicum]|uniref:Uncharacterized protein n=1 Tax=Kibdelosporangium persicum TaxID=2698649 RepID=A0ABX2EZW6_9PSEU|nr:hypothetical protein [Kibdelosporangium persicum]NRN64533.1 hypothetical protein [Kibdelosporangium persicum]
MIDESDPAVMATRAQFAEISARHRAGVAQSLAEYQQVEAANKAYRDEVARREAEQAAAQRTPEPQQKNPWLSRRAAPRSEDSDGDETGYYSNTWMQNR